GRVDERHGGEVQAEAARRGLQLFAGATQLANPGTHELAFELERRNRVALTRVDVDSCDPEHGRPPTNIPPPRRTRPAGIARLVPKGCFAKNFVPDPNQGTT